ncbi:hypothetical protein NE857_12675 [Nocardiopsis exhalans]|uniref:Uncharacterized protein n=1 Tax=Nocardiopsis exhalans TaxID=163604 RepID=A0ABY5DFX8_9ACTN|nr:hypothetical protein [Nocardiopsis exhalans]USY22383.1 hypothetical protein NE857_12675 [Nocardiopsis exhalans]
MSKTKLDRAKAVRWLTGTLGWAGAGVLAATVVFVGWAWWGLGGEGLATDSAVNPRWGASVMVLGVFGIVLVRHLWGQGADPDPAQPRSLSRDHLLFPLFLVVTAVVLVFVALPTDSLPPLASPGDFTASEQAIALWGVAVLVAFGTVLSLGVLAGPRGKPRGLWWAGAPTGVLVVVLVAGLVTPLSEYRPVTHTFLSEAPGEPAPVPTDVSEVGWTWTAPENTEVVRVDAGSHGPVVVLRDGLIALDGRTGDELWTHRARYSYSPLDWTRGVLSGQGGLASVTFRRGDDAEWSHLTLDTATGQIVEDVPFPEEVPWNAGTWSDARLLHTDAGNYVYGHKRTLYVVGTDYEQRWERPFGAANRERLCVSGDTAVLPYEDQIILGEMCADQPAAEDLTDEDSRSWGDRVDAAQESGTVSLVALDAATGEENWRREWDTHKEENPPVLWPGGAPRPGAAPVFLVADRAFDVRTGQDLDVVPADLVGLHPFGHAGKGVYLHADSEGALIAEHSDSESGDPLRVHRTDAEGNVLESTVLPDSWLPADRIRGAVLNDALTHTDITRPGSLEAGERGTSSVVVTPLREGTVAEEDLRRIDFDSDLLVPPEEGRGSRPSLEVSSPLIPVPGALVLALSVGSTPSQATELFALVP